MQQLVQWGFLKEKKILVSAQEDAKPSDRSMSAHFIKMTVNGRFSHTINYEKCEMWTLDMHDGCI